MENCKSCKKCGSIKLIPDISVSDIIFKVRIKCIECENEGDIADTLKKAIFYWNRYKVKEL